MSDDIEQDLMEDKSEPFVPAFSQVDPIQPDTTHQTDMGQDEVQVKQYSKEYRSKERSQIAQEIIEKRASYFERQRKFAEKIRQLKLEIAAKKGQAEQMIEQVDNLENYLADLKSSIVQRVFDKKSVRQTEEQITKKRFDIDNTWDSIETMREDLIMFESLLADESELKEARKLLGDFYQEVRSEYREFLDSTDVAQVMQENNIIFLHGISIGFSPTTNSPTSVAASPQSKIFAALALTPDISCSSIRPGEDTSFRQSLWKPFGLILNGGQIRSCAEADASTVYGLDGSRSIAGNMDNPKEQIRAAIDHKSRQYNEFVVRNPQCCGIFLEEKQMQEIMKELKGSTGDENPYRFLANLINATGLGVYILSDGELYAAKLSDKSIEKGEKIDLDVLLAEKTIDSDHKEKLFEKLEEDTPFKEILIEDFDLLSSWDIGRDIAIRYHFSELRNLSSELANQIFVEIEELERLERIEEKKWTSAMSKEENAKRLDKLSAIRRRRDELWEAKRHGITEYSYYGPRKFTTIEFCPNDANPRGSGPCRVEVERLNKPKNFINIGSIDIGIPWQNGRKPVEGDIFYADDYGRTGFEGTSFEIKNTFDYFKRQIEFLTSEPGSDNQRQLAQIGFALLGLAESLREFGHEEAASVAEEMAVPYATREELHELLDRRMGDKGKIKMTREEFAKFTSEF